MVFENRSEAGRMLGAVLEAYKGRSDVVVLALPRGGVPVGFEVARELGVPLDVFVVRKLGTPGQEELALGAVASGGTRVVNEEVISTLAVPSEIVDSIARREMVEVERREREFRGDRAALDPAGKTVILVDDGLATGSTMRAAIEALRAKNPARIVVAVPVAAAATCNRIRMEADGVVCLQIPHDFYAVGEWYNDFRQTTDEEVRELLEAAEPRSSQRLA